MTERCRDHQSRHLGLVLCLGAGVFLGGCYSFRPSAGGGQNISFNGERHVNAADVVVPRGYAITAVATALESPTGVCLDDQGALYVTETDINGDSRVSRLSRINPDGSTSPIAWGYNGPWDGVAFYRGDFYVTEGGYHAGAPIGNIKSNAPSSGALPQNNAGPIAYGRILKITRDGKSTALISNLPSLGEYHVNGPLIGPGGYIYFGVGSATNSGIVGEDDEQLGWLNYNRRFHDFPAADVTLAGVNAQFIDPDLPDRPIVTGSFAALGEPAAPGQVIPGQIPATGAVMRLPLGGGLPELVGWGFRNPYGMAFDAEGQLFVTDQSYEDRGSRPVSGCGDLLWQVKPGMWYGWPDYHGNKPLNSLRQFAAPGKPVPQPLMSQYPNTPPAPAAELAMHADAAGIDVSRSGDFGHADEIFIAEFGDLAPFSGKLLAPVGYDVLRVDPQSGVSHVFAANRSDATGPASKVGGGGLERPIALRFDPAGGSLYVVDYGVVSVAGQPAAFAHTGVLWKITREQTP